MKALLPLLTALVACAAIPRAAATDLFESTDEWLDRLHDSLALSNSDQTIRVHASGLFDLEFYHFQQPAPALIQSSTRSLFNPRLSMFLDAELGSQWYAFAQARVDRGFDPSSRGLQARLDEYALRYTPWNDARFSLQVGKFATVFGGWVERHDSWDNPFINAPLPYENLTSIWDSRAPGAGSTILYWGHINPAQRNESGVSQASDKYHRLPIIWGPDYASGVSISGQLGKFDYAVEMKNTALSARPETWDVTATNFDHPAFDGRFGFRPNEAWNLGVSASAGPYLMPSAGYTLPYGDGIGDYREIVLGQDISYAWHHWQLWAECFETRFQVPEVGNADTVAYYLEAKYKFTPQLYGAMRWNQQAYGRIPLGYDAGTAAWGQGIWRIDWAVGYRLTAHCQLKLEYSLQREELTIHPYNHLIETQLTLKF